MIAPRALAKLLALTLLASLTTGCGCLTHAVWNNTVANPDRIVAASLDDQDVLHMVVRYDDLTVRHLSAPLAEFGAEGGGDVQVVGRLDDQLDALSEEQGRPDAVFAWEAPPYGEASTRPIVVARPGAEELDPAEVASTLLDGTTEPVPALPDGALQLTLERHVHDYTNAQSYSISLVGAGAGTDGAVEVPDPVDLGAFRTYTATIATPLVVIVDVFIAPFGVGTNLIQHGVATDRWEGWSP